jgi:hypothetical protein
MRVLSNLALGAALAVMLTGGAVLAQSGGPPEGMGRVPAAEWGGHMGRGGRHHSGIGMPFEHIEGRIAFLKAELKITPAQSGLWTAFTDVLRANAGIAQEAHEAQAKMKPQDMAMALPEIIIAHEKMIATHLDLLHKTRAAVVPLYAALNDEQKKIADSLVREMCAL